MDETQKQKLLDFGKSRLEGILLEDFIKIKVALEDLKQNRGPEANLEKLKRYVGRYQNFINDFKATYGVEFQDLQERYNKISSDINKYLQMNNN